jgi:hypothetical protein
VGLTRGRDEAVKVRGPGGAHRPVVSDWVRALGLASNLSV